MRTIENCTPLASVSLSQLIVSSSQTAMIEVMVSDWVDLDSRNSMLVRLLTMWLLVAQNCQLPWARYILDGCERRGMEPATRGGKGDPSMPMLPSLWGLSCAGRASHKRLPG
jgi:hypothetical protein